MKALFIRIVALVAAMMLGSMSIHATSLSALTGETYNSYRAYLKVTGKAESTMTAFRAWYSAYAASCGLVYDRSATGNIAILHAEPMAAQVAESNNTVHGSSTNDVASATVVSEVRTSVPPIAVDTVAVDTVAASPLAWRISDNLLSCEPVSSEPLLDSRMRMVKADIGLSRAVSLYDLYELSLSGNREDDRRFTYAWREYVRKWGHEHPRAWMAQLGGYNADWDKVVRRVDRLSRYAAWSYLYTDGYARELFCVNAGHHIMVYPEYTAGGGAGPKPVGDGHHKVNAAKSRRACSRVKHGGQVS